VLRKLPARRWKCAVAIWLYLFPLFTPLFFSFPLLFLFFSFQFMIRIPRNYPTIHPNCDPEVAPAGSTARTRVGAAFDDFMRTVAINSERYSWNRIHDHL
jgi:hypothetical protein